MTSSQFMDKQITGSGADLFDLMNPEQDHQNNNNNNKTTATSSVLKKEELFPNYDFQPIRTVGSTPSIIGNSSGLEGIVRHSWGSSPDSKSGASNPRYSVMEPQELPKVSHDKERTNKERDAYDMVTVSEIDRTVKKYSDNLLHTLEGVSSRISQLESRTRHLEGSVDDLKVSIGNNIGSTDGKLRQLENILREVQTGVQVLRDKQEITEAQLQLAKLQLASSKPDHNQQPLETSNTSAGQLDYQQQQSAPPPPPPPSYQPPPPPSYQPPPPPMAPQQLPPSLPAPNAPPPPQPALQQNPPPQFPAQLPQSQFPSLPSLPREPSYYPPQGPQPQSQPQAQPPPPPQPQHYQPLPQYSQPMQPPLPQSPSPQLQPPIPHHPEESAPYMPQPPLHQTYGQNIRQPSPLTQPPPSGGPPQYYGPSSGQLPFSSSYGPPSGPTFPEPYPYSGSPSHYTSSTMKPSPFSNSPPASGGGAGSNNYSRLPTAKILPQAVPAGSSSGPASGSGGRVAVDDVVDKVATMGFSREQVRATVRKLTENGQSVDLNVVLDKLMNEGGEMMQPQKGWFGR